MAQKALATPQLNIPGAFAHAKICPKTAGAVADFIVQDANKHHVYFNEHRFYNHLIHHILADYSLGADETRLKEVYVHTAAMQRPKVPMKSDFQWDSDHCLGNEDYYSNYLKFFIDEIELKGSIPCIEEYIFKDRKTKMWNRLFVGVYHPFIHLGYGVEFGIPLMVAEGLAQTIVQQPILNNLFGDEPIKGKEGQGQKVKHATALELILEAKDDKRFDGKVNFQVNGKLRELASKSEDILFEYLNKWDVQEQLDGPEGLRARATELQSLGAALCLGAQRVDKAINLDFFFMHMLTSCHFVQSYIEQLKPAYAASLLRGKFLADLTLYVAWGRPAINLDQFKTYPKKPWEEIIKATVAHKDDHLPKAVRALLHAAAHDKSISPDTFHAMGQMLLDSNAKWSRKEVGYEEAWKDVPTRDVK